jgi:hypothetical protein
MPDIKLPKWAIEAINSHMANFFWNYQGNNRKYHLSNFLSLAQRMEKGGMGIPELKDLNLCLLASWIQRYYKAGDTLWRRIIDFKYSLESPNIFCCNNRNCSPF